MSWSQTTGAASATTLPTGFMAAMYGGGGMGDLLVLTGTSPTLSKDSFYQNVTIQGTGQLKTNGYKLMVAGTLTISSAGSVNDDGIAATGITGGLGLVAGTTTIRGASGSGAAGLTVVSGGIASAASVNQSFNNSGVLPNGGAGGTSGVQAGGAAGVGSGLFNAAANWAAGRLASGVSFSGGGGGGSGGNSSGAGTNSGAGGGGGGCVWIAAKTIANSGRISANGGAGAAATGAGNASGGGGGAGGIVWVITDTTTSTIGTVQVLGGTGGLFVGTGGASGAGVAGTSCVVGMGGT